MKIIFKKPCKFTNYCRNVVVLCTILSSIVYLIHLPSDRRSVTFSSPWRDVDDRLLCLEFVWEFDTVECFGNKLGNMEQFILKHVLNNFCLKSVNCICFKHTCCFCVRLQLFDCWSVARRMFASIKSCFFWLSCFEENVWVTMKLLFSAQIFFLWYAGFIDVSLTVQQSGAPGKWQWIW